MTGSILLVAGAASWRGVGQAGVGLSGELGQEVADRGLAVIDGGPLR
jgi:hypothetical protein